MAFKLNFENKKQIATILLAVGLGLMGVLLMSMHVENSVKTQTDQLSKDYQKRAASTQSALVEELEGRDKKIRDLMQKMEQRQKAQMEKLAKQAAAAAAATTVRGETTKHTVTRQIIDNTRFSLLTPSGKRALTIIIDSLSAVGGLISAGDYVDILADLKIPGNNNEGEELTSILFQNVQVLAVGANFNPESNITIYQQQQAARSLNVTLAVDPEEVGLIAFAQKYGSLRLALRSPAEKNIETVDVAAWESLSDYVLDRQGTEIDFPKQKTRKPRKTQNYEPGLDEEAESFVEIFRGGESL